MYIKSLSILILLVIFSGCKGAVPIITGTVSQFSDFSEEFDFQDNTRGFQWNDNWIRHSGVYGSSSMRLNNARIDNGNLHVVIGSSGSEYFGGAIESRSAEFSFGRYDSRFKPSDVSGVVNSLALVSKGKTEDASSLDSFSQTISFDFLPYTFDGESGEVFLRVQNVWGDEPFEKSIMLDFDPSKEFHIWSISLLPGKIDWAVDGQILHTFVFDDKVLPERNYKINIKGYTSSDPWVKGPPHRLAHFFVDWVKFYPYSE